MQFVAAMLQQARREIDDAVAGEVLDQASARITLMARMNRQLADPAH
jgi:two-component sensor histidine kinase